MPPAYLIEGPAAGGPGDIHTAPSNDIGGERVGSDGGIYKYLKGVAGTVVGSWVAYDEHGQTIGVDSTAPALVGMVAIATAATGDGTYGWYGVDGVFLARAATVADDAKVFATPTLGVCDDVAVPEHQIVPAVWRSVMANGLATVEIHRPFCGIR